MMPRVSDDMAPSRLRAPEIRSGLPTGSMRQQGGRGALAPAALVVVCGGLVAGTGAQPHRFVDITDAVGLGPEVVGTTIPRAIFADLNDDGWPDAIINRNRIFLNQPIDAAREDSSESERAEANAEDGDTEIPSFDRRFVEVMDNGLPTDGGPNMTIVFADVDNDGTLDAVIARNLDYHNANFADDGTRTGWMKGNGDGTFGPELKIITAAPPATTIAVAVADVDLDGRLDLFLGNSYIAYGASYEGFSNDLLVQAGWPIANAEEGTPGMRWTWMRRPLPSDGAPFTMEEDLGGRPTYGAMIAWLDPDAPAPHLIELSYGRRWNRVWAAAGREDDPTLRFVDIAPQIGVDGDAIRHGRYPEATKQLFRERYNVEREDEMPFRANGNTFDSSVGDIDNDGDFDLFIAEITHGWAGDSSDRSRFLVNSLFDSGDLRFTESPKLTVDRVPTDSERWNQGDLFSALADLDQDGRLDLLLSSGDYPDNQRLRFFRGTEEGGFIDATEELGLDHDGSQQFSLADVDRDGDLDILVGQTFFRYTAEMREGRQPRLRLFRNEAPTDHHSIILRLEGGVPVQSDENAEYEPDADDAGEVNADGLGTIVRALIQHEDGSTSTIQRQLVGIGGHAGRQDDFIIHLGIGAAEAVMNLQIVWPNRARTTQEFENVPAGVYRLRAGGELLPDRP